MITFLTALALLILGYVIYGAFVEKVFGADKDRQTPAYEKQDGIDYLPMPSWKVFLIQFLNIAGTGPIFGAIQGILFGPAAYFWIVLGCIFGGATHDYLAGMISLRKGGASLPEVVGAELGSAGRFSMRFISLLLMVMVGAVFVTTPASLLDDLCPMQNFFGGSAWPFVIFFYYILATLLPIDALIGRVYPLFGVALIFMAIGVLFGVVTQAGSLPEITEAFTNHHPKSIGLFPGLCITIACGAVSGFHATQSPMMARCLKNEKLGRPVFYGAMITEGLVALIWAAAAIKFADSLPGDGTPYERLLQAMTGADGKISPAIVVNTICSSWLGTVGAFLAVLGVVAAPITSGDTAFRAARLITADFMNFKQDSVVRRLILAVPLFVIAAILMVVDFSVLWRYFAWLNQTLSIFTFWAITLWLYKNNKPYIITLIPALWMTCVCTTFIMQSGEGFSMLFHNQVDHPSLYIEQWPLIANFIGFAVTAALLALFVKFMKNNPVSSLPKAQENGVSNVNN